MLQANWLDQRGRENHVVASKTDGYLGMVLTGSAHMTPVCRRSTRSTGDESASAMHHITAEMLCVKKPLGVGAEVRKTIQERTRSMPSSGGLAQQGSYLDEAPNELRACNFDDDG